MAKKKQDVPHEVVPKELSTPIKPPRYLANTLREHGPTALYDGEHFELDDPPMGFEGPYRRRAGYTHQDHSIYWDWVSDRQKKNFTVFFEYMGNGLKADSPPTDWRWKRLALQLAELHFPGLNARIPEKLGNTDKGPETLDAVADEHLKAFPQVIKNAEALKLSKKVSSTFFAAKKRHVPKGAGLWWQRWLALRR
jgi:hypothetical protein